MFCSKASECKQNLNINMCTDYSESNRPVIKSSCVSFVEKKKKISPGIIWIFFFTIGISKDLENNQQQLQEFSNLTSVLIICINNQTSVQNVTTAFVMSRLCECRRQQPDPRVKIESTHRHTRTHTATTATQRTSRWGGCSQRAGEPSQHSQPPGAPQVQELLVHHVKRPFL